MNWQRYAAPWLEVLTIGLAIAFIMLVLPEILP